MKTGYIIYCNRGYNIHILQETDEDIIVETENNELICVPKWSNAIIWPSKEVHDKYELEHPFFFPYSDVSKKLTAESNWYEKAKKFVKELE